MDSINVLSTPEKFIISLDKKFVEEDFLLSLVERLRLEYLAKTVNFDAEIENIGNDIKTEWWEKNKESLLNRDK